MFDTVPDTVNVDGAVGATGCSVGGATAAGGASSEPEAALVPLSASGTSLGGAAAGGETGPTSGTGATGTGAGALAGAGAGAGAAGGAVGTVGAVAPRELAASTRVLLRAPGEEPPAVSAATPTAKAATMPSAPAPCVMRRRRPS